MKNSLAWLPVASGLLVLVLALGLTFVTVASKNGGGQLASGGNQNLNANASEVVPSLSLSPDSQTYAYVSGQSTQVGILVDSGAKSIDGVDVVISFDPTAAQVVETKINPTTLLPEVPLNKVDNATGKIRFSALTFEAKPVAGILGMFAFKPLKKGEVNFSFDFTPGVTTDSNIAEHATAADVLGKVTNGTYQFK